MIRAAALGAAGLVAGAVAAAEPETWVLPNGLRVVLQVEEIPLTYVHVYYPVGPQTEPPGLEGIAHFLEHMMFVSSRSHPDGGLAAELELMATVSTASTRRTYTDYRSETIPELLLPLLRLEADRMGALEPSAAEIVRERDVVLEEIAWRSHGSRPGTQLWGEVFRASFPGHPFGRRIEGTAESMARVGEAQFRRYRDAHHGPTGALLVVVGEHDPVVVRRLIEEEFGTIPANPLPVPEVPSLPPRPDGAVVEIDRHDDEGLVIMLGFRLRRESDRDFVLARLAEELLDDVALVEVRTLPGEYFLTLSNSWSYLREYSSGETKPVDADADARRRYTHTWANVRDRMEEGRKADAFAELVEETVARYRRYRSDPRQAATIHGRELLLGEQHPSADAFAEIATALAAEDLRRYLDERVRPETAVFGVSHGRDSGRRKDLPPPCRTGEDGEGLDVTARSLTAERIVPRLASYRRRFAEPIRSDTLANGQIFHAVPVRGAAYGFVIGARTFPLLGEERKGKKRGLTWAYNRLLRTVRAPDAVGAEGLPPPAITVRASPASFGFSAYTSPPRVDEAIRALWSVLENDRLDVDRWQDVHRWMDTTPRDQRLRGTVRARLRRWEMLFGDESPVLGALVPEPAEGRKIGYEQMQELHRKLRKQEGLRLFVVADPAHLDCRPVLEDTFGRGKVRDRKEPAPPEIVLAGVRGEVIADFQERDVELAVTFPPIPVPDADLSWAAVHLSVRIARSRLRERLREREGLAYYCWVRLGWVGDAALAELTTASRPQDAARVYRIVREELRALTSFDEAELRRAQLTLVKGRARWWSSGDTAERDLVGMSRWGDPPPDPVAAIVDVDPVEVRRALATWVDPERFAFTVLGPLVEEEIGRFPF